MQYLPLSFAAAAALVVMSFSPGALAQGRYTVSADEQEVTDSKTGLIWRRCAEGMTWKGRTCTGKAGFYNHSEATARAKAASSATAEWRLPILKELSSIVAVREAEEGKAAIDPNAFPGTPVARYWTASSSGPGYFTYVGFSDGGAGESPRSAPGALRLVRNAK
ncbi:DUF1566 domain-containing protein [Polaromonas sp. YR568]|uniref:Lcl C-terminal domain-containing protein n=1 Tax=Polaromonas sp. YR568 TaxID=1855301 RepID=UPI003137F984